LADVSAKLVPNCKVTVDGTALDPALQAGLVHLSVDLDADLFAQTTLLFADPLMKLISGTTFSCGSAVKIRLGYGANLETLFDGEVVRLEPQFRRDQPISLAVVCQEPLHRLALSQSTRSLNNVDVSEVVKQIAQDHGFSSDAPSGTKQHIMQGNISDAVMLRRLGSRLGMRVRVEGKKLIMGPPPSTQSIALGMADGIRKVKVKVKSGGQVSEIAVHGWDPQNKRDVVGKAKSPSGDVGQGSKDHGDGASIADSSGDNLPPDVSTAEAMAKGRMQKMSEGYIKSQTDMIGDPRMVPGQTFDFDKFGPGIDGTWRIERALHDFSRRGYFVKMEAIRISAKKPAPPAPPKTTTKATTDKAGQLIRPRWKRRDNGQNDVADMAVDASSALEGKSVKFTLETRSGNSWKQVASAQGTVSSGTATATGNLDKLDASDFSNPKWTAAKNSSHTSGDSGEVSMTAKSTVKDGTEVRVILERQNGTGWERVAQKISSVKGGEVKASFTLEHPNDDESKQADAKLLKLPTWTRSPEGHGSSGTLQVRAPGLPDGRLVQFNVEMMGADGKWALTRTVQGKVQNGTASVSLPDVRHPAHAQQPAHADVLKNPTWDKSDLSHGDAGTFSVDAPDLDGRSVAFIVERKDGGNWVQVLKALSVVKDGKAQASASFGHPTAVEQGTASAAPVAKPKLSNPRWGSSKLAPGGKVKALVDAAGLDGATVEFVAERLQDGGWLEAGRATGKVIQGKAVGLIAVEESDGDNSVRKLRFRSSVIANPGDELEAPLDATYDSKTGSVTAAIAGAFNGRQVRFLLEERKATGWTTLASTLATVGQGVASGKLPVHHKSRAKLAQARWGKNSFAHGDVAELVVDAKGLNGHRVKFTIEKYADGAWSAAGSAVTSVINNRAVGHVTVSHTDATLPQSKLRFSAALADPVDIRVRAEMLPDLAPRKLRVRAELVPDVTSQKVRFSARPVPDLNPKRIRFRGEVPVPLDPAMTRLRVSVVGGGADDVQVGGASSS